MRSRLPVVAASLAVAVLALTGCAGAASETEASTAATTSVPPAPTDCSNGVDVVVEYGELDGTDARVCVTIDGTATALEVVEGAGILIDGTAQYGDAIVCRVDGLPSADAPITLADGTQHTESCESMPPMGAYWSLWLATPESTEWAYAPAGIDTLEVGAGDRLGLVFTVGEDSTPPQA